MGHQDAEARMTSLEVNLFARESKSSRSKDASARDRKYLSIELIRPQKQYQSTGSLTVFRYMMADLIHSVAHRRITTKSLVVSGV